MGLLQQLKQAIYPEASQVRDPERAKRIAAAVLLLEMAHADNNHRPSEYAEIRRQLQRHFSLTASQTEELIEAARARAHHAVSLHDYLRTLNAGLQETEKRQVLEMLWHVAYADRELDPQEEHLLRELAELMYLPHEQFIQAKLTVLGRLQQQDQT